MTRFLRAGAMGGALGGVALASVLHLLGEPSIRAAIAMETAGGAQQHREMFSRGVQEAGGAAGAVMFGIVAGAVLGVVLGAVRHRMAPASDWRQSVTLATVSFVTISLVPFLKYPANPPAVGDPATIGRRTALYLIVLACSVVAGVVSWRVLRLLRWRGTPEHACVPAAGVLYIVMVAAAFVVLPGSPDRIDVPATLLWRFRLASIAGVSAFWLVTGVAVGWLLERRANVGNGAAPRDLVDA